jgi:hypothetical protein
MKAKVAYFNFDEALKFWRFDKAPIAMSAETDSF